MLDAALKSQLRAHLQNLRRPVRLVASVDDSAAARQMLELLGELAALSNLIHTEVSRGGDMRKPAFTVAGDGEHARISFAGVPLGHEFTSLVLALLHVGGHPPRASAGTLQQIAAIEGELHFETYISLSCQNCPQVVQALNLLAAINPRITHTMIDGALFEQEVTARDILAVPAIYLNGQPFGRGRMTVEEILAKLDHGTGPGAAGSVQTTAPFDLLVVGGGPAGAAAAIYAARKGIRTGLLAERFGGQVQDTMGIENFISVAATTGVKFAQALEEQVRSYGVELIEGQRATDLLPGALFEVQLASGASLRARSVVLATGAHWRELNVPGEREYRGHGVAYCPHCDGPLFKGKRVAVVGGGNSGVEAAIDLAGIVSQVTLIEYEAQLRADEVLQRKLRSLSNVRVVTSAEITEVLGAARKVSGVSYRERASGEIHRLELEGVFVQIGLLPGTDWLRGKLALTARGEIEVDSHGRTSVPGVFAAGDATTAPYKQIIVAAGDGAKAALSAFDHLVRTSAPLPSSAAA